MIITGKRVVDADFRGEIMVIIINNGPNEFTIIKHERVAKLITKIIQETKIEIIGKLNDTTVTTQRTSAPRSKGCWHIRRTETQSFFRGRFSSKSKQNK